MSYLFPVPKGDKEMEGLMFEGFKHAIDIEQLLEGYCPEAYYPGSTPDELQINLFLVKTAD